MGTYGNLWELMGTCGNLWELMGTCRNLRELVGTCGNLWEFGAWELMGTYGNLWELTHTFSEPQYTYVCRASLNVCLGSEMCALTHGMYVLTQEM